MKNILLTGPPRVGKTTAIKKIVQNMSSKKIGGFYSEEIREYGKRVGFAIETLNGRKGILAHVRFTNGPRVGKYTVNVADIDAVAVQSLRIARENDRFIIIDEIAKMELFSQKFRDEVQKCLDTRRVIGTIQDRPHPFLDSIRTRKDVKIIRLTYENRNNIPSMLLDEIG